MRTFLIRGAVVLAALLVASPAFAAFDDVTLTTDTVLSVNGITLNIYGDSATLETITVNSTNFAAPLQPSSALTIHAPSENIIDVSSNVTAGLSSVCTSATSTVTVSASETINITVTPSSSICPRSTSTGSSGSGSGGPPAGSIGGGGGCGGGAVLPTYGTPAATLSTPASGLSEAQIESILGLLRSFNADQSVIDNVSASLRGGSTGPSSSGARFAALTLPLKKGSTGAQVKTLQQMLNMDAETRVAASGLGSPGNETTFFGAATLSAVQKFQVKWGIAKAGDVGYGNVGPMTRAKLNTLYAK